MLLQEDFIVVNKQETSYQVMTEGNLARTWEKKLRTKPTPPKPRRQFNKVARVVLWVSLVWGMGIAATVLAVHVLVMGYQVDALQTRYAALHRQTEVLALSVTQLRSPAALAMDSQKMHIPLRAPMVSTRAIHRVKATGTSSSGAWYHSVSDWIAGLRGALTGR